MWNMKNNSIIILLISAQKSYFGDDDAICDVVIQKSVWKRHHKSRHEISGNTTFRHTRPSSFLDKSIGAILALVALVLCPIISTESSFLYIMIRHSIDFCKNKPRFMPLIIFHLNCILLLMMKMNIKQFLFHSWKIRAEGWTSLNCS